MELLEGLANSIDLMRSIVTSPRAHAERLIKKHDDKDRERNIGITATFGRLALSDYQRGDPIYRLLLGEFKHEMDKSGYKLADLGLTEDDYSQIQDLTGLE